MVIKYLLLLLALGVGNVTSSSNFHPFSYVKHLFSYEHDGPTITEIAKTTGSLSTLASLLKLTGLDTVLDAKGPFTVFAPNNDAFDAVPASLLDKLTSSDFAPHLEDVLLFHVHLGKVIESGDIFDGQQIVMANSEIITFGVNSKTGAITIKPALGGSATVVLADVDASNGEAHVIDAVLTPTSISRNVVDVVTSKPNLSTLVSLLQLTGLVPVLSGGDAAFTVFAPTDDAFDALFATLGDNVVSFLTSTKGLPILETILTYHVVPGVTTADEILSGDVRGDVTTVSGFDVFIKSTSQKTVMVNDATVIEADLLNLNGVVHVIDSVLLPPVDISALIADAMAAHPSTAHPSETAEPSGTAAPSKTAEPSKTLAPAKTAEPSGTALPSATAAPSGTDEPAATKVPTKKYYNPTSSTHHYVRYKPQH